MKMEIPISEEDLKLIDKNPCLPKAHQAGRRSGESHKSWFRLLRNLSKSQN